MDGYLPIAIWEKVYDINNLLGINATNAELRGDTWYYYFNGWFTEEELRSGL